MKKIFIIGYFGYDSGQLDGQTVKTRNIYDLVQKYGQGGYETRYYDTENFKRNRLSVLGIFGKAAWCDKLIIIPERNSMISVFPIVYLLSRIFRFDLIHVAIGSNQANFLRTKRWFHNSYISMSRKIKAFLVEIETIGKELQTEFGMTNIGLSRNFRVHNFSPDIANRNSGLKIVFMSRISKKKGTEMIFRIGEYLREKYPDGDVVIDFYGPITDDKEEFLEGVNKNNLISYYGNLQPEDIHSTLNGYDLLILPTRYDTEGFPGAILDAYIAAIPVLVSKWVYSDEFVADGETGFIHDKDDTEAFCRSIDTFYSDKGKLLEMKHNAWEESKKHSEKTAWEELKPFL